MVKTITDCSDIRPAGRCRPAVRGFWASILRSTIRLNAIAAARAKIMHRTIASRCCQRNGTGAKPGVPIHEIAAESRANGSAKTV